MLNGLCYFGVEDYPNTTLATLPSDFSKVDPKFPSLSYDLSDFTMVAFHKELMLIGGYDRKSGTCSNLVAFWNTSDNVVNTQRFPAMPTKRSNAAATVHEKYIIVAGGLNECGLLSNVEVLDTNTGIWNSVISLPSPLYSIKHAAYGNLWFLVGEKVYVGSLVQNSPENVWETLSDTSLKYPGVAVVNGHLLAIGGLQTASETGTEIYYCHMCTKKWVHLHHLNLAIKLCTCILLNDSTLLVSGSAGSFALVFDRAM